MDPLLQHWIHSHEEDTDTEMVFRPASFNFPPARGRKGFELSPDGALTDYGIGPTDRRQQISGKWKRTGDDLTLDAGARRVLKIVSVSNDRLVAKK